MLSALTDGDIKVIRACLRAASEGPFFPEWEFPLLFGFSRSEFRKAAAGFPQHRTWDVARAVGGAFNNLLRYPHGHADDTVWKAWIPLTREQLESVEARWDKVFTNATIEHLASRCQQCLKDHLADHTSDEELLSALFDIFVHAGRAGLSHGWSGCLSSLPVSVVSDLLGYVREHPEPRVFLPLSLDLKARNADEQAALAAQAELIECIEGYLRRK